MGDWADRLEGYVEVSERIALFYKEFPAGSLTSDPPEFMQAPDTDTYLMVIAYAFRVPEDPNPGVGLAWEPVPGKTSYTRDSELQNAQTSAWGRAIGSFGIGIKNGIASRQEVEARGDPAWANQPTQATEKPVSQPKGKKTSKATKKPPMTPEQEMLKAACEAQNVKPADIGKVLKDLYPETPAKERFVAWARETGYSDNLSWDWSAADWLALTVRLMVDDELSHEDAHEMAENALRREAEEQTQQTMINDAKGPESGVVDSDHDDLPGEFPDDPTDDDPGGE